MELLAVIGQETFSIPLFPTKQGERRQEVEKKIKPTGAYRPKKGGIKTGVGMSAPGVVAFRL